MRHEKRSLGDPEDLASSDAERPLRHRIPALPKTASSPSFSSQSLAAVPDVDDSTATPSRSSSNQQSRRSSGGPDELFYGEAIFRMPFAKKHTERQRDARPKRLSGISVFPGHGLRGQTSAESEEPESDRSLGRSSSFGSVGHASSSAYDSSLGPCASPGNSLTPRQRRRNRSRSGSSCEGTGINDLRDHLRDNLRCPPAPPGDYQEMLRAARFPAAPPASPVSRTTSFSADPPWRDRARGISSSTSASALFAATTSSGDWHQLRSPAAPGGSDDAPETGGPLSWSARLDQRGNRPRSDTLGCTMEFDFDPHAVKLPMLRHSESAPTLSAQARRYDPRCTALMETSVDEKEDDLEVVDLGPLSAAGAARNAIRPHTRNEAWGRGGDGEQRPATRTRGGDGETRRQISRGSTRDGHRDGWQLSLCHRVAMHCPSSLPTKELFAQRKVPRPVSPLRLGSSRPESPELEDSRRRQDPSLHASIGERLLNMRRSSHSTSSLESGGDCANPSAEHPADVS